ncbi:MAG: hypothetical protein AAGH74_02375 [Pseudomonadota bacterium]
MSDQNSKTEIAQKTQAKPNVLDDKDMDKAAGGWGKTGYYAPKRGGSTTFTQRSSDKGGSSS